MMPVFVYLAMSFITSLILYAYISKTEDETDDSDLMASVGMGIVWPVLLVIGVFALIFIGVAELIKWIVD